MPPALVRLVSLAVVVVVLSSIQETSMAAHAMLPTHVAIPDSVIRVKVDSVYQLLLRPMVFLALVIQGVFLVYVPEEHVRHLRV